MGVFVAFLRGINVAGHRKIKMAALKTAHEAMGHRNVATYLQSGNVVFHCAARRRPALIATIESAYRHELGLDTNVLVRGANELAAIVEHCPIALTPDREARFLHAVLLSDAPDRGAAKTLMAHEGPEEIRVARDTLYVYYTHGSGRSKLTLAYIEKTLGVVGTARNWNTVTKLAELTAGR